MLVNSVRKLLGSKTALPRCAAHATPAPCVAWNCYCANHPLAPRSHPLRGPAELHIGVGGSAGGPSNHIPGAKSPTIQQRDRFRTSRPPEWLPDPSHVGRHSCADSCVTPRRWRRRNRQQPVSRATKRALLRRPAATSAAVTTLGTQGEGGRTKLAGPSAAKEAELLAAWKGMKPVVRPSDREPRSQVGSELRAPAQGRRASSRCMAGDRVASESSVMLPAHAEAHQAPGAVR